MRRALVGVTLAALVLAGCGNGAEADVRRFCELIEQYNKGTGFKQPEQETPEALSAALRDYLRLPEVQAIFDELVEVAPEEVRGPVATMSETSAELVESGQNHFEEPEAAEANQKIIDFTSRECAPEETPAEDGATTPAEDGSAPADEDGSAPADEDGATDPAGEAPSPAADGA